MSLSTHALQLDRVPPQFQDIVTATAQDLLAKFPRTLALIVIGSVAEGSFGPESDLDVVWVVRGPLRRSWWREVETPRERRVQLIPWLLQTGRAVAGPTAGLTRPGVDAPVV